MAHVRKTIRDAVVSSVTGLTTTSTRVYSTRLFPIAQAILPCLNVTTQDEEVGELTLNGSLMRRVNVIVTGFARATANIENTLDTIAAEVETAFSPGSSAKYWTQTGTTFEFDGDGDNPIATVSINFAVEYQTGRSAPETAL